MDRRWLFRLDNGIEFHDLCVTILLCLVLMVYSGYHDVTASIHALKAIR